jgi:hypothetical protein
MLACEFLGCTMTELPKRCENPADYYTILAFLYQKGARIKAENPKI